MTKPADRSWLDNLWQYIGQVPAGAIQNTVANTRTDADLVRRQQYDQKVAAARASSPVANAIGTMSDALDYVNPLTYLPGYDTYEPAIMNSLPASYAAIKSLVTGKAPDPNTYAGDALYGVMRGNENVNHSVDIERPENMAQLGLNISGGMLATLGRLPPAVTVAGKIGRVATEIAVPLRQTGLKTALLSTVPLGITIQEGIDAIHNDPNYTGIADTLSNDKLRQIQNAVAPLDLSDPDFTEKGAALVRAAIPEYASLTTDQINAEIRKLTTRPKQTSVDPLAEYDQNNDPLAEYDNTVDPLSEYDNAPTPVTTGPAPAADIAASNEPMSWQERAAIGIGVLAGGSLSTYAARGLLRRLRTGTALGGLAGRNKITPRASFGRRVQGAIVQQDAPIRSAANEFLTPDQAKEVGYHGDAIINQATGARVHDTMVTGQFPNSQIKMTTPPAAVLEAATKELDPTEFKMLNDGLLAASSLDDRVRHGTSPSFTDKTDAELRQLADTVTNDPKLAKYADAVRSSYRSVLDFMEEQGVISSTEAARMRAESPNYVHMSRDIERVGQADSGSGRAVGVVEEAFRRADEDGGGVQTGATASPVDELPNRLASIIRFAQVNDYRRTFLGQLDQAASHATVTNSAGKNIPLIRQVAQAGENVIEVKDQGKSIFYQVNDPLLHDSLLLRPRATMPVLGQMRQIVQFFTTGAGNLVNFFGATVSPVYDVMTGQILRPKGTQIGVINEALNRLLPSINNAANVPVLGRTLDAIRSLDPSIPITPIIGALRSSFDEMTGALATSITSRLMQGNDWIVQALGPQKATALRDVLAARYESSIRSLLDSSGAGNATSYGSDIGNRVPIGLNRVAPHYASALAGRIRDAANKNDWSTVTNTIEGVLAVPRIAGNEAKAAWSQLRATPIARAYTAVLRAAQEGYRYQYAATNLPRVKSMQDFEQLVSNTRRIAIDSAQHGGSDKWNRIADSVMYANIGMQSFAGWARAFAKDPMTASTNTLIAVGALTYLRYAGILGDPDIAQTVAQRTDAQNTTTMTGPGGIDIPIEQMYRVITGPMWAYLDQISGVADGTPDPDFVQAVVNHFDEGGDPKTEEMARFAASEAFTTARQSISLTAGSVVGGIPGANAVLAASGVDPSMTRMSGAPVEVQSQRIDPLAGEGRTTHSLNSAQWDAIISSAVGSGVTDLIKVGDDFQRALYARNGDGTRAASPAQAARVAMGRYVDSAARTKAPLQSMLFGSHVSALPTADTDFRLYSKKQDGVDLAVDMFGRNILRPLVTGSDPRTARLRPLDVIPSDYSHTPLAPIGAITTQLMTDLRKIQNDVGQIGRAIDEYRQGHRITDINLRNSDMNDLIEERSIKYMEMLRLQRQAEDAIRTQIGDPSFTYDGFDPKKYVPSWAAPE